jgi:hypothetical protein
MAIRRFSTASIKSGAKSSKFWDQSTGNIIGSYDALATVTVPSGGLSSITFAGIPTGYKDLQIRGIGRTARTNVEDGIYFRFNNTTTGYNDHHLYGGGTTASSFANTGSDTEIETYVMPGNNAASNIFGVAVIDILDYASTNKFKTLRQLGGFDNNSTNGRISLTSGLWRNTEAINTITLIAGNSTWLQNSTFALYGVK